jgi:hypothetical protein
MKFILSIILSTLLIGCSSNKISNNTLVEAPLMDHVPGDVSIGLNDNVSLEDVTNYIYSLNNISINSIMGFQYYSDLPKERMDTLKSALESKTYIMNGTVYTSYIDSLSKILVEFSIGKFSYADIRDWESFKEQFLLTHLPYHYQGGLLKVEPAKEYEWIQFLSKSGLFRFAELNYITHVDWNI